MIPLTAEMMRSHESEPSESGSASAEVSPTSRSRKTPLDREDMTLLAASMEIPRDPSCSEDSSRAVKCGLVAVIAVLCFASAAAIIWFGRGFLPITICAQWPVMPAAVDQQQLERREEALRQRWMEALQREREARRRWEKRKQQQIEEKRQFDAEREQLAQQEKEKEDEEDKQKEEEKQKLEDEKARLEEQKQKIDEERRKRDAEEEGTSKQNRQSSEEDSQRECKEGDVACPDGCHTATLGETCYREVQWGMTEGIHAHPEWYPGLDFSSSFNDFQAALNESGHGNCSLPCKWQNSEALRELATCLCIFDIDRTLTGRQGAAKECPGGVEVQGVRDAAYGGGILLLSELATHLNKTFCHDCYRGIVTAGDATGHMSLERARVLELLGGISATLSNTWSHRDNVVSSLVVGALDGHKQESVREIVHWFREQRAIRIEDSRVHFFDDRDNNIQPFAGTGFNARQVSCTSRGATPDSLIGYCGGNPKEVVEEKGVYTCSSTMRGLVGDVSQ